MAQKQKLFHPLDSSLYVYISKEPYLAASHKTIDRRVMEYDIDNLVENLNWCKDNEFEIEEFTEDGIILKRNRSEAEINTDADKMKKKQEDWYKEKQAASIQLENMYQDRLKAKQEEYEKFKQQIEN